MNNLPLQPLVWIDYGNGTASETRSALHEYDAWQTDDDTGWYVGYFDRRNPTGIKEATGFATIDEAKAWAWKHYPSKMQPYVKPAPTWIDVSEQLPQVDVDTQFICSYDSAIEPYVKVTYFDKSLNEFGHEHEGVLAWMPIPEFSTMQNMHKGE